MARYKNLGGNSGVVEYEIGEDSIRVAFDDGWKYLYTYQSAGSHHIEQMKQLALYGQGLNSYIKKYVEKKYARKFR
ncbi:MAG: hypothetical protein RDV48_29670 [Candidatus Eremiobacteraeota bacterium]|nr:hypothetical protein [Candidatus Eremiobacteraeota bacterium]